MEAGDSVEGDWGEQLEIATLIREIKNIRREKLESKLHCSFTTRTPSLLDDWNDEWYGKD